MWQIVKKLKSCFALPVKKNKTHQRSQQRSRIHLSFGGSTFLPFFNAPSRSDFGPAVIYVSKSVSGSAATPFAPAIPRRPAPSRARSCCHHCSYLSAPSPDHTAPSLLLNSPALCPTALPSFLHAFSVCPSLPVSEFFSFSSVLLLSSQNVSQLFGTNRHYVSKSTMHFSVHSPHPVMFLFFSVWLLQSRSKCCCWCVCLFGIFTLTGCLYKGDRRFLSNATCNVTAAQRPTCFRMTVQTFRLQTRCTVSRCLRRLHATRAWKK